MTTRRPPRKLSDVLTPTLSSSPNDGELETEESSDDSNLPPFDLAAALQCVSSIPSPSPTVRTPRRGRPPGAGGRWPKKPPVVTETTYCFTLRGPNSLLKTDKTAQFTIGGVYELKCGVLTPGRTAYACRTLMTLFCDDPHIWSQIDKQMESGILLNGQTAPKHIMTMDRPSPRTHRNVKAGRNSLEFTWDASGTIFVYLRFLAALSDLCSDPCTLRLCIQSTFLDEPYDENTKTLMIETVGHPSLIDTSAGSTGSIDVHNDPIDRIIPEDPTRELLFEAQPTEIDDTDFVRNVINNVAKGMVGQDNSPMAMIERAIQDSLQKPEDNNGRFEVRVSAATLGEALGSFLNGSTPTGHTPPNSNTPRPRGRPRKFHYPEYCYSKTALQKQPPSNPSQWGGPAAEMMAIQEMQRKSANAEIPEKRIKMDILDEKPINMLSLMNGNGCLFDESDKPSSSCMEDLEPCQEVKLFLTNRRMGNYCGIFAKFTLSEMRALSSEDCRVICANDAEGLRLYHSLRQRQSASSSSKLRIFVAPKLDEEEEPCYELLNLIPPTVSELQNCLHSKGMMGPEVTKICVTGPNGINVQLSDEILETWEDNSVFQCYSSTNVLKMIPVNDSS